MYNLSLENPLCLDCLRDYNQNLKSELLGDAASCFPLLFSADWFEKITALCSHDFAYGCSASSVSNRPSPINSLLTNPPLMVKLNQLSQSSPTVTIRECSRCQKRESNGFFDKFEAILDRPDFDTNLVSIFELIVGSPSDSEMRQECFQQFCLTIIRLFLERNADTMEDSSFPPQLYRFLLCSRTHQ